MNTRICPSLRIALVLIPLGLAAAPGSASADVGPLLSTQWGQAGVWQTETPLKDGEVTYPGCTTTASAQVLHYYRHQDQAQSNVCYGLEHAPLSGPDVYDDGELLCIDFETDEIRHDFDAMALDDSESTSRIEATARFLYHVGVTLNAQFGGGQGSSATAKQIENAFRYQWGYNEKARREMSIISKEAFGMGDDKWEATIKAELDAGRPVLYMAQEATNDSGHAFVIDGYRNSDGKVHVNYGWGGRANGWYDANTMDDGSGRYWNRQPLIFRGLEPIDGMAADLLAALAPNEQYSWNGNFSLVSYSSGTAEGYGLDVDESQLNPGQPHNPVVFLQWEVDARDGNRVRIDAPGMDAATVTYGRWDSRDADRRFENVSLPLTIDPTLDGFDVKDGEWFVFAVAFDQIPASSITVTAEPTTAAAGRRRSSAGFPITVDGGTWNGNGSIISAASGKATGYGLTQDMTYIHPTSERNPVTFFQWEVDAADGTQLELDAAGMDGATITYGPWNDRSQDVTTPNVSFPFVIDPSSDGRDPAADQYYVVRVAFDRTPSEVTEVSAIVR